MKRLAYVLSYALPLMLFAALAVAGQGDVYPSGASFTGDLAGSDLSDSSDNSVAVSSSTDFDLATNDKLHLNGSGGSVYIYSSGSTLRLHTASGNFLDCDSSANCSIAYGSWRYGDNIQLRFGSGPDYWLDYNSSGTAFELQSTNVDGSGTDGTVLSVADGTDDIAFAGEASIGGITSDGSGKVVCIKADGNLGTCSDAPGAGGTCTCG